LNCVSRIIQESLASAKVSARQQCEYESTWRRNLLQINVKKHDVEKYIER